MRAACLAQSARAPASQTRRWAETLAEPVVHAGGLLGAVGTGACQPDPQVGLKPWRTWSACRRVATCQRIIKTLSPACQQRIASASAPLV